MTVVASAPGKVLLTGGYLILDRPNAGLVLSTNARFYAIVKPIHQHLNPECWLWAWTDVKLTSPQLSRETTYKMSLKNSTLHVISSRESANPFVEQAVQYAVAAAHTLCIDKDKKDMLQKLLLQGLDITILGSNDFYSYRNQVAVNGQSLQEAISDVLKGNWDHEKTKFCLPPLMTLLLGEPGTGGSSTPSMVGAVKKWQTSEPQKSQEMWRMLSEANLALERQLKLLGQLAEEQWEAYKCVICSCSGLKWEQWKEQATDPLRVAVVKALLGARDAIFQIRFHMRQMGMEASVPIEPELQTQLLDATMNLEGVLVAGVPGAGGFDAVFAVTLGEASSSVTEMWSSLGVLAMLVREDPRGVSLESNDPRAMEISTAISSIHLE